MNFVMSYSCGKDSALALYRMISKGHKPIGLLVMVNQEQNRSWFHGVSRELLEAVSRSMNIPLLACSCRGEDYNAAMEEGLRHAKKLGAAAAAFGDIDIEDHRTWCSERSAAAELQPLFPLWRESRLALTQEVIDRGFKAMIKCVEKSKTDPKLLGQTLTTALVEQIVAGGADACGENGEYHTFVYDGPTFSYPLPIEIGAALDFGTHAAIDIKLGPALDFRDTTRY
ncbi:MAG TPA: diphthine--ammonia ligase [Bacillota bacterium]|nr:diphthine--ammonia ligase [Bacillota bacterium]